MHVLAPDRRALSTRGRLRLVVALAVILTASVAVAATGSSSSAAAGPFSCAPVFYQVSGGKIYTFDPATTTYTQLGSASVSSLNGIGYRLQDNYVYGMAGSSLYRIDSSGAMSSLGTVTNALGSTAGGDMDASGRLITAGTSGNSWRSTDVDTRVATTVTLTGATWSAYDLTIVNEAGTYVAYGLSSSTRYRVDLSTNVVTSTAVTGTTSGAYGAAFSDATARCTSSTTATGSSTPSTTVRTRRPPSS